MKIVITELVLRTRSSGRSDARYATDFEPLRQAIAKLKRTTGLSIVVKGPQSNLRARVAQVIYRANLKLGNRQGKPGWISLRRFRGYLLVTKD